MKVRVFGAAMAAALVMTAAPVAAQQKSDSYDFLQAVRKRDGTKVNTLLGDKGNRIVNVKDRETGEGALHIVVGLEDATYLRVLLQQDDVNPNLQDKRGNTALNLAASRGWVEGVEILLRYGANVNLTNSSGENPLIRAVQESRNVDIVDALLKAGADPDRTDNVTGKSARDYAREGTRWPAIAKLLAAAPKLQRGTGAAAGPKL